MAAIRRIYIYLVCGLSLQGLALAAGSLLRSLLVPEMNTPTAALAFSIAALLVGTPAFLVHWLWAQRLARAEIEERYAGLRVFYLHLALAGFLGQALYYAYQLLRELIHWPLPVSRSGAWCSYGECGSFSVLGAALYFALPLLVFAGLWFYQRAVLAEDGRLPEAKGGLNTGIGRLYLLSFSAAGLVMVLQGAGQAINRLLAQIPDGVNLTAYYGLDVFVPKLLLGLPLWLAFWQQAQQRFAGPSADEKNSTLRKLYLYGWVFEATVATVTFLALLLTSLFRRGLGLDPQGTLADVLPWLVVHAVIWAYHAGVLRQDIQRIPEGPRQAGVRRLYHYLLATVGLAALLVGAGALLNVLILAFEASLGSGLRERLAWAAAAALAGLPVWLWSWRQLQTLAVQTGEVGAEERGSLVRKIYLYLFLLAATLTVLACAVYLVYQLLLALMGAERLALSDVALPLGYALIGVAVLVYHSLALRTDWRLAQQAEQARLAEFRLLLLDDGDGFGPALRALLQKELPGAQAALLDPAQAGYPGLAEATLIVVPAPLLAQDSALAAAVQAAPGRKLLLPLPAPGWEWAGVDRWDEAALLRHSLRAVQQSLAGEPVRLVRPMAISTIILLGLAGFFALTLLISLVMSVAQNMVR